MRFRTLLVVGSMLLLAAACSNGDEDGAAEPSPTATETEATGPTETEEPTESPEASETEDSSRETEIEAEDSSLGTILTDSEGQTLYVFLSDADGESTCYDDCATSWPALRARGELAAGDGVDAALLGSVERTDGGQQVTYAGQPLYYFSGDEAPGDTNGQELGDVWYVVSPEGEPIEG